MNSKAYIFPSFILPFVLACIAFLPMAVLPAPCSAAQSDAPEQAPSAPLSSSQLEKLVEPIALYPDTLLQQVLAASTFPEQILDAALFHEQGKDPATITRQPWDESVKAIANYPSVLTMLASDLDWTITLASAFINQSVELRNAIQRLRSRAKTLGNLETNNQQIIIEEQGKGGQEVIRVEPTNPQVVYVPTTTTVIYEEKTDTSDLWVPLASFGVGMALGYAMGDEDDDDHYYYGGYYGPSFWHDDHCVDRWADYRQDRWDDAYDFARDRQEWQQDNRNDWREHRQELEKKNQEYRSERRKNVSNMSPEQRAEARTRAQQSDMAARREQSRSNRQSGQSLSSSDRTQANARLQQARSNPQVQQRAQDYKSTRGTSSQGRSLYERSAPANRSGTYASSRSSSRPSYSSSGYNRGSSYSGMGASRSSVNASRSRGYASRGSMSRGGGGRSYGGGGRRR